LYVIYLSFILPAYSRPPSLAPIIFRKARA
jgi:hypothetical protein